MSDPLSVAAGVVGLATVALSSSVKLYTLIRSLQSQNKKARALKNELAELNAVLQSLLETVHAHPDINFCALTIPLERCASACDEYAVVIDRCTAHSTATRPSVRDWLTQKYLQGDVDDFHGMIATYKSTINIALANANLNVAVLTPQAIAEYKDLICDTTADLKEHLELLEEKIEQSSIGNAKNAPSDDATLEWKALLKEKQSVQEGLRICAQLKEQINRVEPGPIDPENAPQQPSTNHYLRTGLDVTKGSINDIIHQLHDHEACIDSRITDLACSSNNSIELEQLEQTKQSLQQCIQIISEADTALNSDRRNLFEDITLEDDAFNFTISTVGDLVTARRLNLKGRSRNVGGQISDESFQKAVDSFSRNPLGVDEHLASDISAQNISPEDSGMVGEGFGLRHGRGVTLNKSLDAMSPPGKRSS